MTRFVFYTCVLLTLGCAARQDMTYQWLENIEGADALSWVRTENKKTLDVFEKDPRYERFLTATDTMLNATDRIAYGQYRGGHVYNFWQDETNVRGILRRTSLASYQTEAPQWETILDVDELAKNENENWVYKGSICLEPNYSKCLLRLSRGGTDASVYREFDMDSKAFVSDGFVVPQAKAGVSWINENELLIGTDWGEGSLTQSGYPRQTRLWKRGQPLEKATLIYEGELADVGVWPGSFDLQTEGDQAHDSAAVIIRAKTFYTTEVYWVADGKAVKLPLPDTVEPKNMFKGNLLVSLRKPWTVNSHTYPSGALVGLPFEALTKGDTTGAVMVWAPTERSSLEQVAVTQNTLYLSVLEDVKSRIYQLRQDKTETGLEALKRQEIALPGTGTARIASAYSSETVAFVNFESFTTPDQLMSINDTENTPTLIDALPPRFDAEGTAVQQFMATSKDGEKIPYFLVTPKGYTANGNTPTLLYGYGGFEISLTPSYRATYGKLWLERGGAYVIANIRGGGEFGPRWHQAALKENRQRAYDDFAAVATDLINRKVTRPERLGIAGGSNGGLLVGVTFTQRPELFNAVVCQVPLLDMLRYTKLLAGASWAGEYGDPEDPKMRSVIQAYSPFHNLSKSKQYPQVFFVTSTKDDRVHPGHARKMAAKMQGMGHPIYYFENIEGGHSASANLKQTAKRISYEFVYLSRQLGLED